MSSGPVHPDVVKRLMRNLTLGVGRWAGQRLEPMEFQDKLTEDVFAIDPETGKRRYSEAYIHMARKNTKTTTTAAWALALLTEEPGGEVLGVAAKREQARLMMDAAKRFVRNSSFGGTPLDEVFTVRRNAIYFDELDAVYRVISADAKMEHGANPHAVLADELHAWTDPELYYAMVTATAARENPLVIGITTPGETPQGLWYDLYKKAKRVLKGEESDERFYAALWEAPADCDLHDEAAYEAANPALDTVVSRDYLHRQADTLPEYVFRRLHLAQPTTAHDRWLPLRKWNACGKYPDIPTDAEVYLALDAAISRDRFGAAMVYVDTEGDDPVAHVKTKAFKPDHEGGYIDPGEVRTWVLGIAQDYRVKVVRYDPAFMGLLASDLEDRGIPMEPLAQSATNMTRCAETLQRYVLDERLRHGDDTELHRHMANVGVKPSDRGVRISKGKSGGPIDLVVALAMALDAAHEEGKSRPETHFAFAVGPRNGDEPRTRPRTVRPGRRRRGANPTTSRKARSHPRRLTVTVHPAHIRRGGARVPSKLAEATSANPSHRAYQGRDVRGRSS